MKKRKELLLPKDLRILLKAIEKNHQFVEQERNVERDWNQVTSVSLSLKFPLKDSTIGDARVDLIGRKDAFFKLDRFNVSILSADTTLMADMSHTAKLHYGAYDGPTFEFPFICTEEWEPGMYEILIHDDDDDSVLVIEFFLGDDSYPPHSYVCRDNETEEVDVRFHLNINNKKVYMEQKTKAPLHAFKDEQSGKWGFKNVNDEIVVSPRWWLIYHKFDEGMCAVADDDKKIGFVDETGKLVIPCQYVSHSYFCEGLVKVQEAETYKIGYINKEGKTVIPFVYRKGVDYENGLAMVSSDNGLWGAINQKNMVVYPFKYGWEELYDTLHKCGIEKTV